ncbi:MAG TPA: 16S rRNA (uracil(1498)-N(3))-methyltransferase [Acidimicrobiales bacterium]|nr:16S rRNA (uracil(1498)-N(3))-methyltransferase [Acidimicrobiales bacterium]
MSDYVWCPVPVAGGPLVFVADVDAPVLGDDDHHHLARVRRVRDGQEVVVADGRGVWRTARMAGSTPEPVGPIHRAPHPAPEVGVAFALVKGHKPELVVQKHLGSDSLARWLEANGWPTTRRASRAGYRLLSVSASRPSHTDDPEDRT